MDICNVAIIVNSNYNFYETTIEPLIISSKKANIPSANIYVVVGECDHETDIIKKNDYNIIFCKYVNISSLTSDWQSSTGATRPQLGVRS